MDGHLSGMLVIIIICVIMSAYFSATETAFNTFNRIRVKGYAEKGNKKAQRVLKLADGYDRLISTILVGNNIVNIAAASLTTLFFAGVFKDVSAITEDLNATISTAVMTVVMLTFGEITPKSLAKQFPEKFSMFSAPIIYFFHIIHSLFKFITGASITNCKCHNRHTDYNTPKNNMITQFFQFQFLTDAPHS